MGEDVSTVTRLQGYQFELRINEEEAHQMRGFAGSCRFVFNRALALQQEIYDLCGFRPGFDELCEEMARWKKACLAEIVGGFRFRKPSKRVI
jgi:putative transposase